MNGLFVSAEHQETVEHRQHPCFRGTFYVLVLLLVAQIPIIAVWLVQSNAANKEQTVAQSLERDKRMMDADEQLLLPVTHKIEQAAEWRRVLAERKRVGEILAGLENSVPANACLNQVSIRNQTTDPKSPDRMEVKVMAWLKGEPKEIEDRLKGQFPGYLISSDTVSGPGNETEGAKAVEISIIAAQ